jgi:dienelactone hydrolase
MSVRGIRTATAALLAVTVLTVATPVAHAATPDTVSCAGWLGTPVSGSAQWNAADANNLRCAGEGLRILQESPAVAAAKAANADAGDGDFVGDPFRAPHRWAPKRGRYEQVTFTDRDGNTWPATLFGPRNADGGPYPGVLLVCHACFPLPATTENVGLWYWAAEALAEAGYVVLYATVGGNSAPHTIDATDFFVSTPTSPTARGEFNPWWARLDRDRLGIIGHSGAAGVALNVGNSDPRFRAIVAWDPAASASFVGVTPRIPTMIQAADYTLREGPVPHAEKPVPAPGYRHDAGRAAGVDAPRLDAVRRRQPLRAVDRPRGLRRDGRHVLHARLAGPVRRGVERGAHAPG